MICQNCGAELYKVEHWEDDGEDGSYEPYYDCPNGCSQDEQEGNNEI